jgi:putative membrane protein
MMRYYGPEMMGYYGGFGFSPFHFISGVLTFLFWFLVILLVIRFIRRKKLMDGGSLWMGKSASDIVRERYAKGEIDKAEFLEKLKDLQG